MDYHGDRIDNRRIGDIDFIIETLESGEIARYYEREQYPEGVLVTALVTGDLSVKDEARANAIPEFMRFNIIENEVRNVI